MGGLFSKKAKYWVPEHRKLHDLVEDDSRSQLVDWYCVWAVFLEIISDFRENCLRETYTQSDL
jgi:hypothetical protein